MAAFDELLQTMARLRGPGGCPWDREQTHRSIRDCLVEECAELLDTIDRGDFEHMREELGDVLLQVVFHAQLASEAGHFSFDDIAREINAKLVRRHPHVFGEEAGSIESAAGVLSRWEQIKAGEKKPGSTAPGGGAFKDLPPALPALLFARDVYKQIRKKALPAEGLVDAQAAAEEAVDLTEEEAGARLFRLVAACREAGIDPESALRAHAVHVLRAVETRHASHKA